MYHLRSFVVALVLIVLAVAPVAARQATPAASPAASPVSGAAGLRVVKDRVLTLNGKASALSPDGKWIAGPNTTTRQFCVWSAATGQGTCQGKDLAIRPETITWAPDSSAVAFSLNAIQLFINSDIYIFETKEQKLHDITEDEVGKVNLMLPSKLTKPVPVDDVPAWSPDGKQLAFVRTVFSKEGNPTELMRIDRAGGTPVMVSIVDNAEPFAIYEPMKWLPDNRLLFTIDLPDASSPRNGLWQIGVDGKEMKLVLDREDQARIPSPWLAGISPDGQLASVYSPHITGLSTVPAFFLVDLTSFKAKPVKTSAGNIATAPLFSPDGRTLLYLASEDHAMHLVVQDRATGQETVLIQNLNEGDNGPYVDRSDGVGWATDNSVLIRTFGGARLLTLERVG